MAYATLPTVVDGAVIQAAWGNQVKANFDASPNGLASAAGQLFYATAAGTLVALAPGATNTVLQTVGGVPVWVVAPTVAALQSTGLTDAGGLLARGAAFNASHPGGVEALFVSGTGYVQSTRRDTAVFLPLVIQGAPVTITGAVSLSAMADGLLRVAGGVVSGGGTATGQLYPSAHAYATANQLIPPSQQVIALLQAELYDNDNIHDPVGTPTRLTCRTAGVYQIDAVVALDGLVAGGYVEFYLLLNSSPMAATTLQGPSGTFLYGNLSFSRKLAVNDVVEMSVVNATSAGIQYRGITPGPITVPQLAMTWVSAG
jgi:hypothetical protein